VGVMRGDDGSRSVRSSGVDAAVAVIAMALLATACSFEASIGLDRQQGEAVRAVGPFGVLVGDCYEDPVGATDEWVAVDELRVVACDEPHDLEVLALFDLPGGSFPGHETILEMMEERCIPIFDVLVGRPFDESELSIQILAPTEETWARGDREVVCSAYALDGTKLVGSIRGSGR
jgi:hypothetical protein